MGLLGNPSSITRMDERIGNVERILFLMVEVVCKNFGPGYEREDRLREAFCELAGCQRNHRRVSAVVRRELAKC